MTHSDKSVNLIEKRSRSERNYENFSGSNYAYAYFGYEFVFARMNNTQKYYLAFSKRKKQI